MLNSYNGLIALVGAGQMGGAILQGWLKMGLSPHRVVVFDPKPSVVMQEMLAQLNISLNPLSAKPDVLMLAVKPQMALEVMNDMRPYVGANTVVLSVMAGTTLAKMAGVFGENQPIVRTIPNTPASVGRGITAAFANSHVNETSRALCNTLLTSIGRVEWVEGEGLIDVATAVSGSGPAYVFLLAESLGKAGAAAGLPLDLSMRLARATVEGAGELLYKSPAIDASRLRENVTSPKGTTYAALEVLMGDEGLDALLKEAVAAATKRSRELA